MTLVVNDVASSVLFILFCLGLYYVLKNKQTKHIITPDIGVGIIGIIAVVILLSRPHLVTILACADAILLYEMIKLPKRI